MKKVFSLILAVCMTLSLCACGDGSSNAGNNSSAPKGSAGDNTSSSIDPLNITFNISVSGDMYDQMTNTAQLPFRSSRPELSDPPAR